MYPEDYAYTLRFFHSVDTTISNRERIEFKIECANPRPAWNIDIVPRVSPFGTLLGNDLYWNACMIATECCCPCSYEIRKNGILIGVTNNKNFTGSHSFIF